MKAQALRILQWNSHSIRNKVDSFHKMLEMYCPHVICICETWLTENVSCKIKTFNIYREDRLDGYGGVLLGVQKSLESIPIKLNMRNKKIEVIARKIVINKNYEFDVASVYIHSA